MPPPPAPGAPVRLGVGLAAEFGVDVRVGVLDAAALCEELALPLAEPLPLADPLTPPEPVPVGGGTVPDDVLEDGEQAANTADARMAKTPKRTTVSFALSTEPEITRTVM